MKKITINQLSLSEYSSVQNVIELIWLSFLFRYLLVTALMFLGMVTHSYAATEGNLAKNSSASMQVIFSVPENLNVYLSNHSSFSNQDLKKSFCVLGTGIDHYRLSISKGNDGLMATNNVNDASFQVTSSTFESKIIPADNTEDKLVLRTDRTCEQPLNLEVVDSKSKQQAGPVTYSGVTILSIAAE